MTQHQLIELTMERLFEYGYDCPNAPLLATYAAMELSSGAPDVEAFAKKCLELPGVTCRGKTPDGDLASVTAGASFRWLAIHEAGHAVVGVKSGQIIRGVRFYGNGYPGATHFKEDGWAVSKDPELLRTLIRIGVAGRASARKFPVFFAVF